MLRVPLAKKGLHTTAHGSILVGGFLWTKYHRPRTCEISIDRLGTVTTCLFASCPCSFFQAQETLSFATRRPPVRSRSAPPLFSIPYETPKNPFVHSCPNNTSEGRVVVCLIITQRR